MLILSDIVISLLQTTGKPHKYTVTFCEKLCYLWDSSKPDFCITLSLSLSLSIPFSFSLYLSLLENEHILLQHIVLIDTIHYNVVLNVL